MTGRTPLSLAFATLGMLAWTASSTPAVAQSLNQALAMCMSPHIQTRITSCTRLLTRFRLGRKNRAEAYGNRALAYIMLKQYRKAIADLNQAIRLNPGDTLDYQNRGVAYYLLKQYRKAIADYNQAIRVDPRNAFAYYGRGLVYQYGLRSRQRAIADYLAAYRLKPGNAEFARKLREMRVRP